jgi:Flp pilus assembly protein TadG
VDIRNPNRREYGGTSVYVLVILVPVLIGFMGFAVDLGQLYLIRGELKAATDAMALAAAAKLIGTEASIADATAASQLPNNLSNGFANKYNFGSLTLGQDAGGDLTNTVAEPAFFSTYAAAVGTPDASGASASSAEARHVAIQVTADAPLLFWSFLSLGQSRKTPVIGYAVAGVSAPLCTACAILPIAIAAIDAGDSTDFGLTRGSRYTLGFQCNGPPTPGLLANSVQRIPYLLLNRYDDTATIFADESTQAYRIGAQGLPGNVNQALGCMQVNASELVWTSAPSQACNTNTVPNRVSNVLCGLASRFQSDVPAACANVAEVDSLAPSYSQDTDLTDLDDYTQYIGNKRRIITIAVVDALNSGGTMTVLGFRQFLVEPALGDSTLNVTDPNGRFSALYIGYPVPVQQGSFFGCSITAGPGKVVLHQ